MPYDPFQEGPDAADGAVGDGRSESGDDVDVSHDECACLGALEDWLEDHLARLVPDHRIVASPLHLSGPFAVLARGYAVIVGRLLTDLLAIQDAVLCRQTTDEQALVEARMQVYAAILESRGARSLDLLPESPCGATVPPALAQVGQYAATVRYMYEELQTLSEEYGLVMHPFATHHTARREN